MLYQLAYVSLSRFTMDQTVLSDILETSRRNNSSDAITGVLMYHGELFFQVLEGQQSVVEACYFKRIFHDPRHDSLSLVWSNQVESRTFSDWSMGYLGPDEIGRYKKNAFHPAACLTPDGTQAANESRMALELARAVFSDYQRHG